MCHPLLGAGTVNAFEKVDEKAIADVKQLLSTVVRTVKACKKGIQKGHTKGAYKRGIQKGHTVCDTVTSLRCHIPLLDHLAISLCTNTPEFSRPADERSTGSPPPRSSACSLLRYSLLPLSA
eukprot:SAG22_NODE_13156_length_416_cov_1.766562_1_plen_121_part_01